MILCEWCEQPTEGDNVLCHKCLEAQARVSRGQLIPPIPPKKQVPESIARQAGNALLFVGKSILALIIGMVMIVLALLGTCLTLVTAGTLIMNPFGGLLYLFGAAACFGVTYLLAKLTFNMFDAPMRPIETKRTLPPAPPPAIEQDDLE